MKNAFSWSALVTFVLSLATSQTFTQDRRYFPEVGPQAIHQRSLDLSSSATVLMVALQPGSEDLSLLARLRLGVGARTYVLYWTNGEATPNDAQGASPSLLATTRREEAFHAAALLGAQVYYLNLPDPGVVSRRDNLLSLWNPDSTLLRLVPMIRSFGPDVIVIGSDFRGDSVISLRQRVVTELMVAASRHAAEGKEDSLRAGPWRVQRVLVQTPNEPARKEPLYDQIHPLWKVSYRAMAQQAASMYKTLHVQLPSWLGRGDRYYSQILPKPAPMPKGVTDGVPVISQRLKSLAALVRSAAGKDVKGVKSPSVDAVAHALDSLKVFYGRYGSTLQPGELHLLSFWMNGLEDLRCSLLDVSIAYHSSDSLVTQSQLMYLRFTGFSSRTSTTHTKILFPGVMQKRWAVNESAEYQYDLTVPREFRVITPNPMDFNYPGAQFGITRPFARNRFSFLINHQDTLPGRDFVYRGEILLQSGPRRTFELLTPAVRALDGEPVVYRLQNISRDAFEGSMSLQDSILNTRTKRVHFSVKDEVVVDTLFLSFKQPPPPGTSTVTLSLSGMGGTIPVVVRRFDAAVDTSARIVLVSQIEDSPLTQAMHRLRLPYRRAESIGTEGFETANVLVIDRDALAYAQPDPAQMESLQAWIRQGGHLVVFPQGSVRDRGKSIVPWATFEDGPQSAPTDSLVFAANDLLLTGPNPITSADWTNWVVSRSMWPLRAAAGHAGDAIVQTARGRTPLLLSSKEGKGRVTLVALDLPSQLVNLHPGVHRLLANLLRAEK